MWGYDKRLSTLWIAILVVWDEKHGALLSWCAIMSDKKFGIVCICYELIELDLKSLSLDDKNLSCEDSCL